MKNAFLILLALLSFQGFAQFMPLSNSNLGSGVVESSGVAWIDFDRDGDDDLFITTSSNSGVSTKDILLINNSDGTFSKVTTGEIVNQELGAGRSSSWADYNNDGYIDALVVDQLYLTLFMNSISNTFVKIDEPPTSLLALPNQDLSSSSWGDYNGDGFLDLFVAAYRLNADGRNYLYKNNGDGSFENKSGSQYGITSSPSQDVSWIDYNNDHLLDLFISNYGENNLLYKNKGDGTFEKIDIPGLTTTQGFSIGSSWADYDNDGDFDVVVVVNANSNNLFFENNGDGSFTQKPNLITNIQATGSAWADFDNDGFVDIVLIGNTLNRKTYLFKNNGNKTFTDVSLTQGINNANYSQGVAWGDFNKDGFLDIFIANGVSDDLSGDDILYVNTPNQNKWISIKLTGKNSNKSAIGAVVKVKNAGKTQMQSVQSQTGKNSMNSLSVEFGLGQSAIIDTLQINWPLKGFQEFLNVNANQFLEIEEIDFLTSPSNLSSTNLVFKQTNLEWKDNSEGELGFRIERSKGDQKNFKIIGTVLSDITTFQDVNLQEGITYYYRITAIQQNGFSLYSNISAVYMKKNQQINFTPIGEKYLDSEPFKLSASTSSGLPPTFMILDGHDNVSLSGDLLSILSLGISKLGAFQPGNDSYFPSSTAEQILEVKFITGIEDLSKFIKIYPNPAKTILLIERPTGELDYIKIYNTSGELVNSTVLIEPQSSIPIDNLPEGLYIILNKWGAHKFIKTN
jgi:enediyne biosynthesis protein E4